MILVIVIGSLAHDVSRLNLRTLYMDVRMYGNRLCHVSRYKHKIPTIVSRMKCLPNSGPCQGIDRRSVGYAKARHVRLSL